jgi:asparagine synthase (glutamine-hydrolysing)
MFALGIWDIPRQRLVLARDRLGVKPLYFARANEGIAFASEAKALLDVPWVDKTLDPAAIDDYLRGLAVSGPRTLFQGIRRLEPGQIAVFDAEGLRLEEYWDVEYRPDERPLEQIVDEVDAVLRDSVELRMISDVPLGVFLSGGVDSGVVAGMMAGLSAKPIEAFSIGFGSDAGFYDELEYAERVAARYDMHHHVLHLEASDLVDDFERIVWFMDEPCGDPATFLTLAISEHARRHVTVALSGLGGDELFAGYRRHLGMRHVDRYLRIPAALRRAVIAPLVDALPDGRSGRVRNGFRKAKRFVDMAQSDVGQSWRSSLTAGSAYEGPVLTEAMNELRRDDPTHVEAYDRHWARAATLADPVDAALYLDTKLYLPDQLLLIQDKMSMAVSLEAREPFLDYRLVELAATIPATTKLRRTELKIVLKRLAERYMPRECIYRPKQGFAPPLEAWLRGPLRDAVHDRLETGRVREHGVFETAYVEWLKREFYERRRELTLELYQAFLLETWLELFVDRRAERAAPAAPQLGHAR